MSDETLRGTPVESYKLPLPVVTLENGQRIATYTDVRDAPLLLLFAAADAEIYVLQETNSEGKVVRTTTFKKYTHPEYWYIAYRQETEHKTP